MVYALKTCYRNEVCYIIFLWLIDVLGACGQGAELPYCTKLLEWKMCTLVQENMILVEQRPRHCAHVYVFLL